MLIPDLEISAHGSGFAERSRMVHFTNLKQGQIANQQSREAYVEHLSDVSQRVNSAFVQTQNRRSAEGPRSAKG